MHHRWLAALFGLLFILSTSCSTQSMTSTPEHAVIIHFTYGSTDLRPLFALEEQLEQAIVAADVGEFDGNEVAANGSDGYLYMYGQDADRLFEVVRPILESSQFIVNQALSNGMGHPRTESVSPLSPLLPNNSFKPKPLRGSA